MLTLVRLFDVYPVFFNCLPWTGNCKWIVGNILCNCRACAGESIFANSYRCHKVCVTAYKCTVFNNCAWFVSAVVVNGYTTATEVNVFTYIGISYIEKVRKLTAFINSWVLYLNKVTDMNVICNFVFGLIWTNGPAVTPSPISELNAWVLLSFVLSPTIASEIYELGPITQPLPIFVPREELCQEE